MTTVTIHLKSQPKNPLSLYGLSAEKAVDLYDKWRTSIFNRIVEVNSKSADLRFDITTYLNLDDVSYIIYKATS